MNINIYQFVKGAQRAAGLTVIIDVFRAFSVAAYLAHQGAKAIIPVADPNTGFQLKDQDPKIVLIGEREEKIIPGYDFGNSPLEILNRDFRGQTVVHATSAGTRGLVHATRASEIITGSFVNAAAIVRYISEKEPLNLSLVAMGYRARESADEDMALAEYIKNELEGRPNDFTAMKERIKQGTGKRFFDPANLNSPPEDFNLCLDLDRFSFVLNAVSVDGMIRLKKISI